MQSTQYAAFVEFVKKGAKARGETPEQPENHVFSMGLLVLEREPLPETDQERHDRVQEVEYKAAETASLLGVLGALGQDATTTRQSFMFGILSGAAAAANMVADATLIAAKGEEGDAA